MFSESYKRCALATLTLVITVNTFDRGLMFLLLQPIKVDLQLSDTQIGFLTGIASGLFATAVGVPLARWADRGNRVTLASFAMTVWSLTAMALFFVTSYVHLLIVRIVAGVGDAGAVPPAYSLMADYFPQPAERMRAMYIWGMAGPIGSTSCFMLGGWLNDHYGWKLAFLLSGGVGLLVVGLIKGVLVEPRIAPARVEACSAPAHPPRLTAVLSLLWNRPSCRHLAITMTLLLTVGYGAMSWQGAFLMRSHGMSSTELGFWMGTIGGFGGLASLLLGRYVVNRWFFNDERRQMHLAAATTTCAAVFYVAFLLLPSKRFALVALTAEMVVFSAFSILPSVLLQRLVPDQMRATMLAVMTLLANMIAYGIGPLVVGVVSDLVSAKLGATDGLRYAMMFMLIGWIWASYHYLQVAKTVQDDLAAAVPA
jgi:MFS family permease